MTVYLYSTTIDDFSNFVPAGVLLYTKQRVSLAVRCVGLSLVSALPRPHPTGPLNGFWMGIPVSRGSPDGGHPVLAASPQHNRAGELRIQQIGYVLV